MSHRPDHLEGTPAGATWKELYDEAQASGRDPEGVITVKDESKAEALRALAAVGGATVTERPDGGRDVQLAFEEPEGGHEEPGHNGVTAAAKRHTFS